MVVVEKEKVKGIFSERDFARRASREHEIKLDTPVKRFDDQPGLFVQPNS